MEKLRSLFTRANALKAIIAVAVIAATIVIVLALTGGKEWATVQLGSEKAYLVKVADNAFERSRGLSNTVPQQLGEAVGMLFVFDDQDVRTFWMNGMNYNLDFVWLREGQVMKIDYNVPAPQPGESPESVSSDPIKVDAVLELPAGYAAALGYVEGHMLTIDFDLSEQE